MSRLHPAAALMALFVLGCNKSSDGGAAGSPKEGTPASDSGLTKLGIEDKVVGKGKEVKAGDKVFVRYRGYFKDGREFDGNMTGGKPEFDFVAGPTGSVIKGWQQGIIGMKEGGKRKLSVPWNLAYGESGSDSIPPKSDLYFDIELKSILSAEDANTVKRKHLKVGSGPGIQKGQKATVKVEGSLLDGTPIDRSDKYTFTVGKGEVLPGVDAGIVGTKKGGVVELTIPPVLAFGASGKPPAIPANSVVKYKITLLNIG